MTSKKTILALLACPILLILLLTSCLGDETTAETIITNHQNATVKSFKLEDNPDVCSNLSGYSFTIDHFGTSDPALSSRVPNSGIIFNPDSLPVGTEPDSIKISMELSNASSAILSQYDRVGLLAKTVNYLDTQLMYFNEYSVTRLDVVSFDESVKKSYFIKVNVHKVYGDTIRWKYCAKDLWDINEVTEQNAVMHGGSLLWFREKADGNQTLATSEFGKIGQWEETQIFSGQKPSLQTITSWNGQLYAVGKDGALLCANDPITWEKTETALEFVCILGPQLATKKHREYLHAIVLDGSYRFAKSFDGKTWEVGDVIPEGFPIRNFSNPIADEARPSSGNVTSRLYIVGGETANGKLTSSTWSCDGTSWAEFPQGNLPSMKRAAIIEYTLDTDSPKSFWILWPGIGADGSVSNTPYFSQNKGVTWKLLSREFAPYATTSAIAAAGGVSPVMDPKNYWMYFLGGTDSDGRQLANIFGGQLTKLTFDKIK